MTIDLRQRTAVLAFLFALLDLLLLILFTKGGDWGPLWAAGRLALSDPSRIYDFAFIAELQRPIFGEVGKHPFIYPPSALLFITPFALLPFTASWLVFIAVSAWGFAVASARIGASRVVLVAPPVFLAALVGQTTLLVAAFGLLGLSYLRTNAVRAGVLLGLAASIKPTLFILAPIALIAGGHWRAMFSAGLTGLGLIALAILCFGHEPWLAWIAALPDFQAVFLENRSLVRTAVTPFALGERFGVDTSLIIPLCAIVAAVVVFLTFRRSDDVADRSAVLFGGALLVSPYGMNYELALLAPAVMTLKLRRLRDLLLPLLFGASLFATASLAGLLAVYAWFAARGMRLFGDDPRVERRVDIAA